MNFFKKPENFKTALILLLIIVFVSGQIVSAQNADELREKINQHNDEIANLEKEIANYQRQLALIGQQANTLQNSIKSLDLSKQKLLTDIKLTNKKIDATNLTIKKLESAIGDKEGKISLNVQVISQGIKTINEYDSESFVEAILSNERMAETWNHIENLQNLEGRLRDKITENKEAKIGLEENKKETQDAKDKLVELVGELSDQKKIVDQNTKEKQKLLQETKNQESNYNKTLAENLAKKQAFEKELQDYESQLRFVLDPKSIPKPGTVVFNWPLDNVFITQLFGKTVAAQRLYTSGSHSGVDFRASTGTPVKAMADGKVLGTGDTDLTCPRASFGKWVFIEYKNGLSSTYGHLSLIKAREGQSVKKGDIVGYSGNTGYSTAPHLHVSLYASNAVKVTSRPSVACGGKVYTLPVAPTNAYLDVLQYLPRLSKDQIKEDKLRSD